MDALIEPPSRVANEFDEHLFDEHFAGLQATHAGAVTGHAVGRVHPLNDLSTNRALTLKEKAHMRHEHAQGISAAAVSVS